MKKWKDKGKKSIAVTAAIGLMGSSCSGYIDPPTLREDDSHTKENQKKTLPIFDSLNADEAAYLDAIVRITKDIVEGNFKENGISKDTLKDYGYKGEIQIDGNLQNILIAFSDKDISRAIIEKNFEKFLHLVKERNLVKSDSISYNLSDETIDFIKKMNHNKFQNLNNSRSGDDGSEDGTPTDSIVFEAIAIAFLFVVVGVEFYFTVFADSSDSPNGSDNSPKNFDSSTLSAAKSLQTKRLDAWDAYISANGVSDIYNYVNRNIREACDMTLTAIEELNPGVFGKETKEEMRRYITILYMNYLFDQDI